MNRQRDHQHEGRCTQQGQAGEDNVQRALHDNGANGEVAPVQRDGRELADKLHRRIPGQAVVQVRHHADIDAERTRFLDQADDDLLFRRD